jgi:hypothetical protein
MSEDVKAAAERILNEVKIHLLEYEDDDLMTLDMQAVAAFVLEAADRQAALAAELGRVKAALLGLTWPSMPDGSPCWCTHRQVFSHDEIVYDWTSPHADECEQARAALGAATAVAPGASDAGEAK